MLGTACFGGRSTTGSSYGPMSWTNLLWHTVLHEHRFLVVTRFDLVADTACLPELRASPSTCVPAHEPIIFDGSPTSCDILSTPVVVEDLVRAALKDHFAHPKNFMDDWELEPLTPLPSPFQSPTTPPGDLPMLPPLTDVSSMPVICPSLLPPTRSSSPTSKHVAVPLAPHPGRTRSQEGKRLRRNKKRKAAANPFDRKVKSSTSTCVAGTGMLKSSFKTESLHIARGAYVGRRQEGVERHFWTLDRLRAEGFSIQKWDGRSRFVIVDGNGRILALFAGPPDGAEDWDEVTQRATEAMEETRKQCTFRHEQEVHARGLYPTAGVGASFGGGSTAPGAIKNSKRNAKALARLCRNPAIQRIAGFGSSMLASYAPRVHLKMQRKLRLLYERHPSLPLNFTNSIYPAAQFNFGPKSVCFEHTDFANDPINWCHVTALGRFNPTKGGHILLLDLRLAVEFPAGASCWIPSAIARHANVAIQEGEKRLSFTQFCPGGLLRWVDAGFQTLKTWSISDPAAKANFDAQLEERTHASVLYFSRFDELLDDLREASKPDARFPELPDL